jgi:GNAT superfamily N-acetyltransferase
MVCEQIKADAFRELPDGYTVRLCRRDELETWKRVIAFEAHVDYVTAFYREVYQKHEDEFFRRCTFICDKNDKPVASTFIWRSYGLINTIGWYRVLPEYEGKGLGRAILSAVLKTAQYPVYLHTQPTSIRAIKLYSDFGFKLITDPIIGSRVNNISESLPFMKKVMPEEYFSRLQFTKADDALLRAVRSSEVSEF